jgi:hypothetical protein
MSVEIIKKFICVLMKWYVLCITEFEKFLFGMISVHPASIQIFQQIVFMCGIKEFSFYTGDLCVLTQ